MINHWYLTKWNEFKLLSPARVETLLYLIQQHIPAFREFDRCLCFTECLSHGTYFCLLAHLYALTMKVGCKCDHDFIHTSISCFHFSSADFMHNDCEPELEKLQAHTGTPAQYHVTAGGRLLFSSTFFHQITFPDVALIGQV